MPKEIEKIIAGEVNVKKIANAKTFKLDTNITPRLKTEGEAREIIRQIQQARKEAGCNLSEKVDVVLPSWPKSFTNHIKKETLTRKLIKGEKLEIKRN